MQIAGVHRCRASQQLFEQWDDVWCLRDRAGLHATPDLLQGVLEVAWPER